MLGKTLTADQYTHLINEKPKVAGLDISHNKDTGINNTGTTVPWLSVAFLLYRDKRNTFSIVQWHPLEKAPAWNMRIIFLLWQNTAGDAQDNSCVQKENTRTSICICIFLKNREESNFISIWSFTAPSRARWKTDRSVSYRDSTHLGLQEAVTA